MAMRLEMRQAALFYTGVLPDHLAGGGFLRRLPLHGHALGAIALGR
jgi:hypothetical protein